VEVVEHTVAPTMQYCDYDVPLEPQRLEVKRVERMYSSQAVAVGHSQIQELQQEVKRAERMHSSQARE